MSTANTPPPPPAPTHSVVFASKYREFSKYMGLNTTLDSQHFDDTIVHDKKEKRWLWVTVQTVLNLTYC